MVSFFTFLFVIFITATVGFFFEDEVTFTLIFLEGTVRIVPFLAGFGINLIGKLFSFAYLYAAEFLLQITVVFGLKTVHQYPLSFSPFLNTSISITLSGITTDFNFGQLKKTPLPILVTLSGIVMLVKLLHIANVLLEILVIPSGNTTFLIYHIKKKPRILYFLHFQVS